MKPYLDLLAEILEKGARKPTRAKLQSTSEHIAALSLFGRQIRFDLSEGFPLLTNKQTSFYQIAHELFWFLSGVTNIKYLTDRNIQIWTPWADSRSDLGPVYGKQWRQWYGEYHDHDQIQDVIAGVKEVVTNPTAAVGRRLLVSAWNVGDLADMALVPCHFAFQFDVTGDKLSCHLNLRSSDTPVGLPYNIACYALLTHIVAHLTGLVGGTLIVSIGDAHIYENQVAMVEELLSRNEFPLPTLEISKELVEIDQLEFKHLKLHKYQAHPAIKAEIAV